MAPRVNSNGYFRFVDGRLSNCLFTQLFTHRKNQPSVASFERVN
jgi:hypothetical protein